MKTERNIVILLIIVALLTIVQLAKANPESKSLNYDLEIGSKKIGELTVSKTKNDGVIKFEANSHAEVNFFGKIVIDYELHCVFKDGIMVSSIYRAYKNGELHEQTLTSWKGDHYEVVKDGKVYTINQPIKHSSVELYFDEPILDSELYSEKNGGLLEISQEEGHVFKVTKIGKRKGCEYSYTDHKLDKLSVDYVVTSFNVISAEPMLAEK